MHTLEGKAFDIFISYKSEDIAWVTKLKEDLHRRGVKVWLDKDEIRPGDLFVEALEHGVEISKTMGLVITPESLKSNWVREEYYRALSLVNEEKLRLIPILLRRATLPGFMKGRQYVDFSNSEAYEHNVDRLVWPGITGKRVVIAWVQPGPKPHGYVRQDINLRRLVRSLGVEIIDVGLDIEASWWHYPAERHIAFVNLFEDDQAPEYQRTAAQKYVDFVFQLRELTKRGGGHCADCQLTRRRTEIPPFSVYFKSSTMYRSDNQRSKLYA